MHALTWDLAATVCKENGREFIPVGHRHYGLDDDTESEVLPADRDALQLFEGWAVLVKDVLDLAVIFSDAYVDDLLCVWQFLDEVRE